MDGDRKKSVVSAELKVTKQPLREKLPKLPQPIAKHMKKIAKVFLLAAIVVVGVTGYSYYDHNYRVLLTIGEVKYDKRHYKKLLEEAKKLDIDETQVPNTIILAEKTKIAAKQLGVEAEDQDRKEILASRYGLVDSNQATEWQNLNAEKDAIDAKVQLLKTGGVKGAVFEFPFSRTIDIVDPSQAGPEFGKPEALEADKKYAMEQAASYRAKLTAGTKASQAIADIKKDKRLVLGTSGNKSQEFIVDKDGFDLKGAQAGRPIAVNYIAELNKLQPNGLSPTMIKKKALSYYAKDAVKEPKEVAYYFVQFGSRVDAKPSIQTDMEKAAKSIKVDNKLSS